jgi:hypothetical protein
MNSITIIFLLTAIKMGITYVLIELIFERDDSKNRITYDVVATTIIIYMVLDTITKIIGIV